MRLHRFLRASFLFVVFGAWTLLFALTALQLSQKLSIGLPTIALNVDSSSPTSSAVASTHESIAGSFYPAQESMRSKASCIRAHNDFDIPLWNCPPDYLAIGFPKVSPCLIELYFSSNALYSSCSVVRHPCGVTFVSTRRFFFF